MPVRRFAEVSTQLRTGRLLLSTLSFAGLCTLACGAPTPAAPEAPPAAELLLSEDIVRALPPRVEGVPALVLQTGHTDCVGALHGSADGQRIVTGGFDGALKLWDGRSGALLRSFEAHAGGVSTVSASADGRFAASAGVNDQSVKLWDAERGKLLHEFVQETPVETLLFSEDGVELAVSTKEGGLTIYRVAEGAVVGATPGTAAGEGPGGRTLLRAADDFALELVEVGTGKLLRRLVGHTAPLTGYTTSPDGSRVATSSEDGTAIVWDFEGGKQLATLRDGVEGPVAGIAFTPDGRSLLSIKRRTARLWDARTFRLSATLEGHGKAIESFAFVADEIVTGSWDKTAKVWNARTGELRLTLQGNTGSISTLGLSQRGPLRGVGGGSLERADNSAWLWDLERGVVRGLSGHRGPISRVALTADGALVATASWDKSVRLWDGGTGQPLATLLGHQETISALSFSPDGKRAASGSVDKTVRLWDTAKGTQLFSLTGHAGAVESVVFSPSGREILAADQAGGLRLWDAERGRLRSTLTSQGPPLKQAVFSPDGRIVAALRVDRSVAFSEAKTGRPLFLLQGHAGDIECMAFSPDGHELVTGSWDKTARVWSTQTGALLHTLEGHAETIASVTYSPDGELLATASYDGWLRLWRADGGSLLSQIPGKEQPLLAFVARPKNAPAGHHFLVSAGQGLSLLHLDAEARLVARVDLDAFAEARGAWSALGTTRDGLFSGDDAAFRRVRYRIGELSHNQVTADDLFDRFYRPALLEDFWGGRELTLHPDVALGVGLPPQVELLDLPKGVQQGEMLQVRVRARSRGGGVSRIELFANGAAVAERGARGLELAADGAPPPATPATPSPLAAALGAPRERIFEVPLLPGKNQLVAFGYGEKGSVRGSPAQATVERVKNRSGDPAELHLFALSLENYADATMKLNLPHEDAAAIVDAFKTQRGRLFDDVKVTILRDDAATLEGVLQRLDQLQSEVGVEDVFVFYAAGHGGMVECEGDDAYYFATYRATLRSRPKMCSEGLGMKRLSEKLRAIKANKKLLILDACQSGAAATADMLVSMRGAEEVDAIRRLARSEGMTILAASKQDQYAIEDQGLGHGLFTYALLEGLQGGGSLAGGGQISVFSLMTYVDRHLPAISGGRQQANYSTQGTDFPVYMLRPGDVQLVKPLGASVALASVSPEPEPVGRTAKVAGGGLAAVGNALGTGAALATAPLLKGTVDTTPEARNSIKRHVTRKKSLVFACTQASQLVLRARVGDKGQVQFSLVDHAPESAEAQCIVDALGELSVQASSGVSLIPLEK